MSANQRVAETSHAGKAATDDPSAISARARLKEQYDKESNNLEAARLKFTPTHPEIRRLEEEVSALRGRIGDESSDRVAAATPAEVAEYQALTRDRSRLVSKLSVLESSRDEQLAAGKKSDAYSRYRRIESELVVDRELLGVLLARRNETMLASAKKDAGAQILDRAIPALRPAGPPMSVFLAMGWVGAFVAGLGVAIVLELLDRRLRDTDRIAEVLDLPTLCVLPIIRGGNSVPERHGGNSPGSPAAEAYRGLRTALMFAMRAAEVHTLLVTSAIAGEGKTTTSANLAAAFARLGKRVVLIDADMRRPRLHRVFNLPRSPGVAEVLAGTVGIDDALAKVSGETFDLLPAGASPESPADLVASREWNDLTAELKRRYELVVIDSPVLLAVTDSLILAAQADGVVLVHKPGCLDRRGLNRLRSDFKHAGARVLGIVFNQLDPLDTEFYPTYLQSPYLQETEKKRFFRKSR